MKSKALLAAHGETHTSLDHVARRVRAFRIVAIWMICFAGLAATRATPLLAQWAFPTTAGSVAACTIRFGGPSLWPEFKIIHYRIRPQGQAPSRIMLPGEKYSIRYNITSRCNNNCTDIKKHYIGSRAVLGNDPAKLKSQVNQTAVRLSTYRCGETQPRTVNFTVPDPRSLGSDGRSGVSTVTMGVCPEATYALPCTSHTIRVRYASSQGWQVSAPKPRQRAIGSGVNRVAAGKPVTLAVTVKNFTGKGHWPDDKTTVRLKQVTGPQVRLPGAVPLPGIGDGKSGSAVFQLGALGPGIYSFKACLNGKDARGYPAPETCGPPLAVTAGAPDAGQWSVSAVIVDQLGKLGTTAPAGTSIRAAVFINNQSIHNYPAGTRFFTIWRRTKTGGRPPYVVARGGVGAINSNANVRKISRLSPMASGTYEFRACTAGNRNAKAVDSVCGPWTTITFGAKSVRPAPPPAAPAANTCTGGRSKNAAGRCVCPVGSFWNPNPGFKRCYTCTAGRTWDRSKRRCTCPSGTKWNPRAKRCTVALQILPTPQIRLPALGARPAIKCAGGTVSNGSCLCPRGFKRTALRKNVYVCKPPFKRPVPGASQVRPNSGSSATTLQNQLKKPKVSKMQCIGGQVKGPLCWCGIGRFPKKIGNNVYRCQ